MLSTSKWFRSWMKSFLKKVPTNSHGGGGTKDAVASNRDLKGILFIASFAIYWNRKDKTKDISPVKYVERYSLQFQTCASISSPLWGENIYWSQLVSIVAPVSIGKTRDGAHWSNSWPNKKNDFQGGLELFPV